jgi:hypothetical protein
MFAKRGLQDIAGILLIATLFASRKCNVLGKQREDRTFDYYTQAGQGQLPFG